MAAVSRRSDPSTPSPALAACAPCAPRRAAAPPPRTRRLIAPKSLTDEAANAKRLTDHSKWGRVKKALESGKEKKVSPKGVCRGRPTTQRGAPRAHRVVTDPRTRATRALAR